VVAAINALDPQPDLVVHTGDLVHHGAPAQYAPARAMLDRLRAPYVVIPGNHDAREGFRTCFGDMAWLPQDGPFIQYAVDAGPLRLVCLDTVVPGEPWGALCDVRLAWLAAELAVAPDRPTVVACHHPPLALGLTASTKVGLDTGGPEFAAILGRHPQVQRLICGHAHRPIAGSFGGRPAWVAPATCYQFVADMSAERLLALNREPPGYAVHAWVDDPVAGPGLVTHCIPVGDFGAPIALMRGGIRVGPLAGSAD
jgi:Icc protein